MSSGKIRIRFRRPKLKRWQINLRNDLMFHDGRDVDARPLAIAGVLANNLIPRKRRRKKARRRKKNRKMKSRKSSFFPRFRERKSNHQVGPLKMGSLTAFHNGVQVPPQLGAPLVTPITAIAQLSGTVERTWDNFNPGPPYRSGGNFTNIKIRLPHNVVQGIGRYTTAPGNRSPAGKFLQYDGGFSNPKFVGDPTSINTYYGSGISPWNNALLPQFQDLGPKAYNMLKPTPERASVGQFLVELRELPQSVRNLETTAADFHKIWKFGGGSLSKPSMYPKRAADEYLAYQFGWKPFLNDLMSFFEVAFEIRAFLDEVTRLNNTWIRRRRVVDTDESQSLVSRTVDWNVEPIGIQYIQMTAPMTVGGIGTCNYFSELRQREIYTCWAEGSFKFYRPEFDASLKEFDSYMNQVQRLFTLFGARITPTLLWKVTPWTWLADWIANAGKNIDNISAMLVDGVVSKYMYLMHHAVKQYQMTQVINFWDRGVVTMSWSRDYESKQRRGQTTPFGFDLNRSSLNGSQWSILAALGLSKFG
jgi:hypothetical protein